MLLVSKELIDSFRIMIPTWIRGPNTFEDLKLIEKERRGILKESKKFITFSMTYAFSGTVLPKILCSVLFWITMFTYLAIRFAIVDFDQATKIAPLQATAIAIIGGFMSFFLTFFVNQSYGRFTTMYGASMSIEGRLFNLMIVGRNHLPTEELWLLMRYANAAHMLGYVGLSPVYTKENFLVPINDVQKLLLPSELARLDEIGVSGGGSCYREVLSWCVQIIYRNHLKQEVEDLLVRELLTMRGAIGTMYDFEDQPLPYAYMHLLFVVTSAYLPLLSYGAATNVAGGSRLATEIIYVIVIALNAVFVMGMREIGRALMDPYGSEMNHLSVMHYINFSTMQCRRLLTCRLPGAEPFAVERELEAQRPSKGNGFIPGVMASSFYSERSFKGNGVFDEEVPAHTRPLTPAHEYKLTNFEMSAPSPMRRLQEKDQVYASLNHEEV